jgi:hypothetical protein
MKRSTKLRNASLAGLLAISLALTTLAVEHQAQGAAEPSGCVTCHLDKAMIIKNLSEVKAKKSAMQSGAG